MINFIVCVFHFTIFERHVLDHNGKVDGLVYIENRIPSQVRRQKKLPHPPRPVENVTMTKGLQGRTQLFEWDDRET